MDLEKASALVTLVLVMMIYSVLSPHSANATEDSFLFEKNGFRIQLAGTGGNCAGCEWIAIDGSIPPEAGLYLQDFLVKNNLEGVRYNINFNSPGGSLIGAIRLGRVIRQLRMDTSVAKTVPYQERWHDTEKGQCYSACAYAFLGGVVRSVEPGDYGVHQFYSSALLQNPDGKVFTPMDFSVQQATTGLLLSYVMEMGVSAELVIEANKTLPTEMNVLSKQQLTDFKVSFDASYYGPWRIEAHRNGIVAFSRTQDEKRQMTIYCSVSRSAEMLVTYKDLDAPTSRGFVESLNDIQKFALLDRPILRSAVKVEIADARVQLRVPLSLGDLQALETDGNPDGAFTVHPDEPRAHYGAVYENLNLDGLAVNLRLARRNCIN